MSCQHRTAKPPERRTCLHRIAGLLGLLATWASLTGSGYADERERFFEQHIRPILVDHCVACHGPNTQEGGLRLDTRSKMISGGESGPALVVGQPNKSLLIAAIQRQGDLAMPPDDPLSPEQIARLIQWIQDGAFWPQATTTTESLAEQHWSLRPVREPPLDMPQPLDWAQSKIDALLLGRLAQVGLAPSAIANRRTLIRRLSYDLRGLPPTPDEIDRFLTDPSPDAVSRLVDRWLATPQFGEQWARHWLDVARYADNKGYVFFEKQDYPWAYTYRDYVIRALNSDRAYNRFVVEQLAADQLDDLESPSDLAALGFITVGGHFINNTHDIIDDRIDVITRGLLGLTVACARCHDHKYDPISQTDYYALYGVLRSSVEPLVPPPLDPVKSESLTEYNATLDERHQALIDFVTRKYDTLIQGSRQRINEYLVAVFRRRTHPSAEEFMLIADPNDINPAMITRWEAYLDRIATQDHPIWGPWATALAQCDESDRVDLAETLADHASSWNSLLVEQLTLAAPKDVESLAGIYGQVFRDIDDQWQSESSSSDLGRLAEDSRESLRQELYGEETPADLPPELDWGFLSLFPDRATQNEYKQLLKSLEEWLVNPAEAPARAMVLIDHERPADARVFLRGNPNRPGEVVPRRFLTVLDPAQTAFATGSGRRELADAIIDPDNPLTDRVMVNRTWMHLMGQPLVSTPADFGLRSQSPNLPELFDQAVVDFRRAHHSPKALIRRLVLTSSYQQRSFGRAEAERIDPENQYFWRQHSKRLQFEAMRDTLLVAADRLSQQIGGPSEDLVQQLGHRRSLYGFINRLDVPPILTTFDFPNPSVMNPMRQRTTVAPQALFWLNQPHILTLAEEVESRIDLKDLDAEAKLHRLALILWGRPATQNELEWALEFLAVSDPTVNGEGKRTFDEQAWVPLIHAFLMSNETVFID
jgi:mono/diheme cytochrome c family protein